MSAPLIIISGPPGSGKTTVAAGLAKRFDRSAHVLGDHFFRYIVGGWVDPSTPEANEQNGHVMRLSSAAAAAYARAGYTTFLDGIYGPWFLEDVTAAAGDVDMHYVLLRADLETSLERACGRPDEPATEEVVRTMHEHFDELAQYEQFVIDTTNTTPDEAIAAAIARIDSGEARLG